MTRAHYIAAFRAFRLAMRIPVLGARNPMGAIMDGCAIQRQACSHWRSLTNKWDIPTQVRYYEWREPVNYYRGIGIKVNHCKPAEYEPGNLFTRLMKQGRV